MGEVQRGQGDSTMADWRSCGWRMSVRLGIDVLRRIALVNGLIVPAINDLDDGGGSNLLGPHTFLLK
jgi:hypothetical protein